jgi:hypothetical protein
MYEGLNQDSFDWKTYPKNITLNQYGLLEMQFNVSDATLKGSSDSIEDIGEVISRY